MNYEPNTTHWRIGDKVLHDADAKERRMLMTVMAYRKNGHCVTEYREPDRFHYPGRQAQYVNDIQYLHDPKRFGIDIAADAAGKDGNQS